MKKEYLSFFSAILFLNAALLLKVFSGEAAFNKRIKRHSYVECLLILL